MKELVPEDKNFRKEQMERWQKSHEKMGEGLEKIGKYVDEISKANKISIYGGILFLSIILISVIGAMIIIGKEDIKNIFINPENNRNIICKYEEKEIKLKSFEELKNYKEVFKEAKCYYEVQ